MAKKWHHYLLFMLYLSFTWMDLSCAQSKPKVPIKEQKTSSIKKWLIIGSSAALALLIAGGYAWHRYKTSKPKLESLTFTPYEQRSQKEPYILQEKQDRKSQSKESVAAWPGSRDPMVIMLQNQIAHAHSEEELNDILKPFRATWSEWHIIAQNEQDLINKQLLKIEAQKQITNLRDQIFRYIKKPLETAPVLPFGVDIFSIKDINEPLYNEHGPSWLYGYTLFGGFIYHAVTGTYMFTEAKVPTKFYLNLLDLFIQLGADVNAPIGSRNSHTQTPLELLLEWNMPKHLGPQFEIAEFLLTKGASINYFDIHGNTALAHIILLQPLPGLPANYDFELKEQAIEWLLNHNADVMHVTTKGESVEILLKASTIQLNAASKTMLQAAVKRATDFTFTPLNPSSTKQELQQEFQRQFDKLIMYLYDHENNYEHALRIANITDINKPLGIETMPGWLGEDTTLLGALIKYAYMGDLISRWANGREWSYKDVPLNFYVHLIDLVIQLGANVNQPLGSDYVDNNVTPLVYLLEHHRSKKLQGPELTIADFLVQHGANVNLEDAQGNTPLEHIIMQKDDSFIQSVERKEESIQFLLEHGANVLHVNRNGNSVEQLLQSKSIVHIRTRKILEDALKRAKGK